MVESEGVMIVVYTLVFGGLSALYSLEAKTWLHDYREIRRARKVMNMVDFEADFLS